MGRILIIANIYRNPIHDPSSTSSQLSKHCLSWGSTSGNCNSLSPEFESLTPKDLYPLASVSFTREDDYLDPGLVVNISQLTMIKACHPDLPLLKPWTSLLACFFESNLHDVYSKLLLPEIPSGSEIPPYFLNKNSGFFLCY